MLYSTSTCEYCWELREFLHERGAAFVDMDIDASEDAAAEVRRLAGDMVVPVTVVQEPGKQLEVIVGFNRQKLDKALG